MEGMERAELTVKGLPRHTGEIVAVDFEHLCEVVRWGGKVMGIASCAFPHPKEWRLGNMEVPLDGSTVRNLTRAIAGINQVEPSCLAAWAERIGQLPHDVGKRYNNRLLTPKDWMSHFKNVLHRGMRVRSHSSDAQAHGCRCCKHARENITHFASCVATGKIFLDLADLVGVPIRQFSENDRNRFALFALTPDGKQLPEGWINLHLLLWRYVIYQLVLVDTEDAKFESHAVWQAAWSKFESRALAKKESVRTDLLRAESRGLEPPDLTGRSACMTPLASLDETGELVWDEKLKEQVSKLTTAPKRKHKARS